MRWIIFYIVLALVLGIFGYFKDPLYYYGASVVGACAFYLIISNSADLAISLAFLRKHEKVLSKNIRKK